MKLALVGVGSAGTRVVDRMLEYEATSDRGFCRGNALVLDTNRASLERADRPPESRRVLIGDTHPEVDGTGVDGDLELAVEATLDDRNEIRRAFDSIEIYRADAVCLVAGLGGGTGGGTGATLLEEFQTTYEKPVYAIGTLPEANEDDRRAINAARSLRSFVDLADNVFLFDNEEWRPDEGSAEDGYDRLNDELVPRILAPFAAGELRWVEDVEARLDPRDVIRTLATGGVSTVGYASTKVRSNAGFLARLRSVFGDDSEETTDAMEIKELVRHAVDSQLTLPCEVASAERALLVVSGPPEKLSRRGYETARAWLEETADTVEVLAGNEPIEGASTLSATVLLSNVTRVPRIDAIQRRAVEARPDVAGDTDADAWSHAAAEADVAADVDSDATSEARTEQSPAGTDDGD